VEIFKHSSATKKYLGQVHTLARAEHKHWTVLATRFSLRLVRLTKVNHVLHLTYEAADSPKSEHEPNLPKEAPWPARFRSPLNP
jgi:hypothetical protein